MASSGAGVRIAIIDSGVHASHPHVGGVAGGIAIDEHGREHDDYVDRLGHGTAVTAAIKEKAPGAALFAVKVFDKALSTNINSLVAAIDWAARAGMYLANLSLGTARAEHEAILSEAITHASSYGLVVVAARDGGGADDRMAPTPGAGAPSARFPARWGGGGGAPGSDKGTRWLPGSLPGVISVQLDWACPRDRYRVVQIDGSPVFRASGFPREIPGVPPERNLSGISFAVANMTGFTARVRAGLSGGSFAEVVRALEQVGASGATS